MMECAQPELDHQELAGSRSYLEQIQSENYTLQNEAHLDSKIRQTAKKPRTLKNIKSRGSLFKFNTENGNENQTRSLLKCQSNIWDIFLAYYLCVSYVDCVHGVLWCALGAEA